MFNKIFAVLCCCLLFSACASDLPSPYHDLKQRSQNKSIKITAEAHDTKIILPAADTFNSTNTKLRSTIVPTLKIVIQVLKDYPETRVDIVGYTDNLGHERGNIIISEKRAKIVAAYLISHHIRPRRVQTHGRGQADPIANNDTPTGRALNRRVEIVFYTQAEEDA